MASLLRKFFRRFEKGDPLCRAVRKSEIDRIFNILEDIEGVNCRIEKPTDADGRGWRIVVDGGSDETPPSGDAPPPWTLADEDLKEELDSKTTAPVFPWLVSATPNGDDTFSVSMVRGYYLVVSGTSSSDLPLAVRATTGTSNWTTSDSGYVTLAVNASFNENTKKFSGTSAAVSFAAEIGTSGTFANIPVAHVTISGGAATVEQYLVGTIMLPLFPPLKAVTDAVRGVGYNATTGALTATKGTGVAFDDSDSTQDETLFTAVDEEI